MEEKNNTLEDFKKECYVINFKKEYPYYDGDIPFGISTALTEEELTAKYAEFINDYKPYMLLDVSIGEQIKEYKRNEKKHQWRSENTYDCFGYEDGEIERFHSELIGKSIEDDYFYEDKNEVLFQAINQLTEKQKTRIIKHFFLGMSIRSIAREEHTHTSTVDENIIAGLKKLKKILETPRQKTSPTGNK